MKTSTAERARNRMILSQVNKAIRALKNCSTRGEAESMLKNVISLIDKASRKNIVHKNKAARDKSNLTSFVDSLSS